MNPTGNTGAFSDLVPSSGTSNNAGGASNPFSDLMPGGTPAPAAAPVQQSQSLSDKIWGGIAGGVKAFGSVTGANAIGNSLGTAAFNTGQMVQGKNPFANPAKSAGGVPQPGLNPAADAQVPQEIGGIVQAGSTIAGLGAAAPASAAGAIAQGAGLGAAQLGGSKLAQTGDFGQAATSAGEGAVLGGAVSGAVTGIGHLVGSAGDKIMTSVIKPSKADMADGFNVQTLKDYNLGGSLNTTLDKTQAALSDLSTQLNTKLAASPAKVNLNDVVNQTVQELTDSSKLKGFGANAKIMSTLEQLKNEAGMVAQDGTLSIPDAQIVKQSAGSFGAWQYGKVDPESKASEIVYNTFYNKLKTAIEQNSPAGVQDINKQLSKLIPVQNAVLRRLPVSDRSNLISLNDMIGLVGATAHPAALGPTLLNLVSKSGAAGSLLSKLGPAASRLGPKAALGASAIGTTAGQTPSTNQ